MTAQGMEAQDLEKQHRAQLLGLGAIALEMHQKGKIDEELHTAGGDTLRSREPKRDGQERECSSHTVQGVVLILALMEGEGAVYLSQ